MLNLAGLSFLGLGASPPSPELGAMINQASNTMQTTPWAVFAPGVVILIVVVILNLFGDAVNDVLGKHHVDNVRAKNIFGERKAYEESERETA